jgi:hypothetical protein
LFYGLGGLHVHSATCLASLLTSGTPRFTPFLAASTPRFTPFLAASAPRGAPLFTPCHTGHWLCAWCWSGWCWSGWLCLSLSI